MTPHRTVLNISIGMKYSMPGLTGLHIEDENRHSDVM